MLLGIGETAKRCGCSVQTLRHYQTLGLLQPTTHSEGGHRLYDEAALQHAGFIRAARSMGFDLATIREMLTMTEHPAADCTKIDRLARVQLAKVETRLAELKQLQSALKELLTSCAGGTVSQCRIIETLAKPLSQNDHDQPP